MTLARYFLKLCSDAEMTNLHEIARRAKVDPATPWKIKAGRPVRAKTLGVILRALGYSPKDDEYLMAFALWGSEVVGLDGAAAMARGVTKLRHHGSEAAQIMAGFAKALHKIPKSEWPHLSLVLSKPESLVLWLRSRRDVT